MDRVLLACDEKIFATHLENTLRKLGMEVSSISSEYTLIETVLTFKPDVIVVKGSSAKMNTINAGKKLKDALKYHGKVILILKPDHRFSPDELNSVRMDYLMFEPLGALKVVTQIVAVLSQNADEIRARLSKLLESDSQFRQQEESFLIPAGQSFEQEKMKIIKSAPSATSTIPTATVAANPTATAATAATPQTATRAKASKPLGEAQPTPVTQQLMKDMAAANKKYDEKIETFDKYIKNIDHDLKKGINKRQTNSIQRRMQERLKVDPGQNVLDAQDKERQKFAQSLFDLASTEDKNKKN